MGDVVVGVNGSADSLAAVRWAAAIAMASEQRLVLANAWQHGPPLEAVHAGSHSDVAALEAHVVGALHHIATTEVGDISVDCRALRGPVAYALAREAARSAAAVLVVGTRGTECARRLLLGSVSRDLTARPSHVVAVVPRSGAAGEAARGPIVVGVDGSDGSARALRWAADAARQVGAAVVPVHAFDCPVRDATAAERASLSSERKERFEDEWCAPLRASGVRFTPRYAPGDPRLVVRRVAEQESAWLLVVGCRGLGAFAQRLMGSVTYDLVRQLPCTTVIVPSARDRPTWTS